MLKLNENSVEIDGNLKINSWDLLLDSQHRRDDRFESGNQEILDSVSKGFKLIKKGVMQN